MKQRLGWLANCSRRIDLYNLPQPPSHFPCRQLDTLDGTSQVAQLSSETTDAVSPTDAKPQTKKPRVQQGTPTAPRYNPSRTSDPGAPAPLPQSRPAFRKARQGLQFFSTRRENSPSCVKKDFNACMLAKHDRPSINAVGRIQSFKKVF